MLFLNYWGFFGVFFNNNNKLRNVLKFTISCYFLLFLNVSWSFLFIKGVLWLVGK